MGWLSEHPGHEGYLVALVPRKESDWRLRELGEDPKDAAQRVRCVQVACACGWRSPLIIPPPSTTWAPRAVMAPDFFEGECERLWLEHVNAEVMRPANSIRRLMVTQ